MISRRQRQPTSAQRAQDARCRAAILAARPVRLVTDPAEQARIAAEVEAQAAAKVPIYALPNQRGGSYSTDPLPSRYRKDNPSCP